MAGVARPKLKLFLAARLEFWVYIFSCPPPALLFEFPVATVGMPLTLIVDIGRIWASKIVRVAKPIGDGISWKPEDSGVVVESRGFQAYPDFGSTRGFYTRPLNRISGANELSYRADPNQSLRYVLNRAGSSRPIVFGRETISGSFGYGTSFATTHPSTGSP